MGAPTGEGWYSLKDWFYSTYNLDQVERHENYETFKCVVKGILLIAWMLHHCGLRQEIQDWEDTTKQVSHLDGTAEYNRNMIGIDVLKCFMSTETTCALFTSESLAQ